MHDHGLVALIDVMPRFAPVGKTADFAIVQAARVSYGEGTKQVNEDRGLIRYLARHRHTTPFEMVEFKFHHVMPIFVARQWIRHRTANVNEYSARYSRRAAIDSSSRASKTFASRATSNRQGGEEPMDVNTAQEFLDYLDEVEKSYEQLQEFLDKGVAREIARIALPASVYTEWYWKIDLHNLFHFLSLRMDAHAQQEIRDLRHRDVQADPADRPDRGRGVHGLQLRRDAPDAIGDRGDSIGAADQHRQQAGSGGVG